MEDFSHSKDETNEENRISYYTISFLGYICSVSYYCFENTSTEIHWIINWESAFLIQDMLLITTKYIEREYNNQKLSYTDKCAYSQRDWAESKENIDILKCDIKFTPTQSDVMTMLEKLRQKE